MEEADKILLVSLDSLGLLSCRSNGGPFEIQGSIAQMEAVQFIDMVNYMLAAIDNSTESGLFAIYNSAENMNIPKKYKLCMEIAEKLKNKGYHKDIGYNTFFYPKQSDIRNILSFLVGKFPKKSRDRDFLAFVHEKSKKELLLDHIRSCFACAVAGQPELKPTFITPRRNIRRKFYPNSFNLDQISTTFNSIPTETILHSLDLYEQKMKMAFLISNNHTHAVDDLVLHIKTSLDDVSKHDVEIQKLRAKILKQEQNEVLEYVQKGSDGITELKQSIEAARLKLDELQCNWNEYKEPFEHRLNQLFNANLSSIVKSKIKSQEFKGLQVQILTDEIKSKEETIRKLESQISALPSSLPTRKEIHHKIHELQATINKQSEEVRKVSTDIKSLEQEVQKMQNLVNKYMVSFPQLSPFESTLFNKLSVVHDLFGDVYRLIEKLGKVQNEGRLLTESIFEYEGDERIEERYAQVQNDMERLKLEIGGGVE